MEPASVAPAPPPLPRRRRRGARWLLCAFVCFASGGIAGFLFFTRVLPAWLASEARPALESALGGPVSLGSLRPALRLGFAFEARGLEAWPGPDGPALRIERLVARLSTPALARRRLRIRAVELEGVRLRIERAKDGHLAPDALDQRLRATASQQETVAAQIPRQIDLRDVEVTLLDVAAGTTWTARAPTTSLAIRRSEGIRVETRAALERTAAPAGPARPVGSLELSALRAPDGTATATLTARDLDLAALPDGLLASGTSGRVGGVAKLSLSGGESGVAATSLAATLAEANGELELALHGARLRVPLGAGLRGRRGEGSLAAESASLRGHLDFAPGGFALHGAALDADGFALTAEGALARPVSAKSSLAVAVAAPELTPETARRFAAALPEALRDVVAPVLARVEGGALRRLAGRGAAPLARWRALFAGERAAWTSGFSEPPSLSFESEDLALRLDDGHRLEALHGGLSWRGDSLQVRELAARLDEDPTDELDLDLDGVSALLDARDPDAGAGSSSEPLPGRRPIFRILDKPPGQTEAGWSALDLEIDRLAHGLLLWPVVEAKARATPRTGGLHVVLERARWGGVPVRGEADIFDGPPDRIHVSLVAGGPAPPEDIADAPASDRESWARGRYRLALIARGDDRVRSAEGFFRATGPELRLFESELALAPGGRLRGEAELDLSQADGVPYHTRFTLDQTSAADFMALLARPDPAYRGAVEATGELAGRLAPGRSMLAGATGSARIEARDGEVPTRVPLFLYLASASAGLNPFASRDRIPYRKIKVDVALADDRISTENLELHGPDMRIGATGSLGVVPPYDVQSVIGIALRGNVSRTIGAIPVVGYLVLGRDKSLVSLWFHLNGPWETARATLIPVKSLAVGPAGMMTEGMPKFVERGIDALADLLGRDDADAPASAPVGAAPAEGFAP